MRNITKLIGISTLTIALSMGSATAGIQTEAASVQCTVQHATTATTATIAATFTTVTPATTTTTTTTTARPALNKTAATLIKGETLQLKLSGTDAVTTWSSSDKSVASVSNAGKVTARKKGMATITAKSGGKKYKCEITVETPKLSKSSISIAEGELFKLKLSGTEREVKWSSSDRKVAKVGSTGRVRGINAGECSITAKIGKKKYTCLVEVTKEISEESLEKPTKEPDTGAQVYDAILAMQSEYPEGMVWTNDNSYNWKGGIYSGGMGCAAFAFAMSDAAFGELPARVHTDYADIRVGDILRVNDNTHFVIVLEVFETEVVVAEGNYNSTIHWGRRINRDELQGTGDYIMTRYPE